MATLLTIIKLLPVIFELVKAAESAVAGQGQGSNKLEFVLGVVSDTLEDVNDKLPVITKLIGRVVALFNKTGWGKQNPT